MPNPRCDCKRRGDATIPRMPGRECFHCRQRVEEGEAHDCWTTTEAALTGELSEDLRDAWERLRETAADFGEQRIYASHASIMFSRKACYFFVRPKRSFLEVWIFLGHTVKAAQVRKVMRGSNVKVAHLIRVTHRDEVEAPLTDWLREAYEVSDSLTAKNRRPKMKKTRKNAKPKSRKRKRAVKPVRARIRK